MSPLFLTKSLWPVHAAALFFRRASCGFYETKAVAVIAILARAHNFPTFFASVSCLIVGRARIVITFTSHTCVYFFTLNLLLLTSCLAVPSRRWLYSGHDIFWISIHQKVPDVLVILLSSSRKYRATTKVNQAKEGCKCLYFVLKILLRAWERVFRKKVWYESYVEFMHYQLKS